jgi:hypothetical protein
MLTLPLPTGKKLTTRTLPMSFFPPLALVMTAGLALSLVATVARAQETPKPAGEVVKQPVAVTQAPVKTPEPLPVKKITLYRSGVGYFERSGEVSGNAEVQLRFNTDQINDILKSMVLLDLNGGRIDSVSYGSKEPLAKRLASFGINIADNPAASEILQRLRGTPVKISMPEGEFSGTIMNVEQRSTVFQGTGQGSGGSATAYTLPWINLVTKDGVKSFNLAHSTGFQILDAALAEELNKALSALAEYRADRTKTVDLRFAGTGTRRVVVGYVYEMPVWKTSYRVVLPDLDAAGQTKGQLHVQGWAVVENTTDQDWNGVQLSLVSGRPVSFQMDLYEPLFSARPWVSVPTIPGVSPRMFAGGIGTDDALADAGGAPAKPEAADSGKAGFYSMASSRSGAAPAAAPAPPGRPPRVTLGKNVADEKMYAGVTAGDMTDYAAKAAAQAQTVGEVFQFQVEAPVSIERQRSAMIPILTAAVSGKRVSIYNASDGSQFPMRGVEITNDSGLALLPGPISVFDGSAYAGDAQIGQIPKGDKRMLAYALDLEMAVITKPETHTTLTKVTIVNGSIRQSYKDRLTTTYEFSNKDTTRGRTLILEHPKSGDYELADTEKPTEQTQDLYRFTLPIEAGKGKKFTVTQERTRWEETGVVSYDLPTLLRYRTEGKLSDKVVDAVRKAADKQAAINATERTITETTSKMNEISQDQDRVRKNIGVIDKTSVLYATYMTKFTSQETKLEEYRDQQAKSQKQLDEQRADLAEYLRTLNVE